MVAIGKLSSKLIGNLVAEKPGKRQISAWNE